MSFRFWQKRSTAGTVQVAVNRALYGDPRLRDFDAPRIHVSVDRGEVRLSGAVSTSEDRDLAERLVAEVRGISRVENELRTDADLDERPADGPRWGCTDRRPRTRVDRLPRCRRAARSRHIRCETGGGEDGECD